ncbi:MAG: phosphate ABC transporter substrate-binding protein PstS family protein [Clostridia bacterium]|nr:phosphate ABC transporter substrate-binding protein PstS family protein [Clostridia bacterium]
MKLKKIVVTMLTGAMLMGVASPALANKLSGKLTASGSTAILPLAKKAAEEFQEKNPDVTINITGGGSFTGLKQVAEGAVDIGNSDVPAPSEDLYKDLVGYKVAVAPFVIITYKSNPVDNLTQDQLIDIFTGKTTNWKEIGGDDRAITIIGRSKTSGSRATIKRAVLKDQEFTDKAVVQDSNGSVRAGVSRTSGSIGYVDAAFIDDSIKVLKFNGVQYTDDNVINGKYPVWAYQYMFTKGEAKGLAKEYINYVLSSQFQNSYLEKLNYIPIAKIDKKAPVETKKPDTKKPEVQKPNKIKVIVNGKQIALDVDPVLENGRTLVPVRAIFEALGAKVTYTEKTKTVVAVKGKTQVKLVVSQKKAFKNKTSVTLDVPAKVVKGRTMVPLRFAGEAFGGKVTWNEAAQTATITLK